MSFIVWCPDRGETREKAKVLDKHSPEEAAEAWAENADFVHRWQRETGGRVKHDLVEHDCTEDLAPGCVVLVARDSEEPERYRVTAETRVVYEAEREGINDQRKTG
jgi:hypothetical protein